MQALNRLLMACLFLIAHPALRVALGCDSATQVLRGANIQLKNRGDALAKAMHDAQIPRKTKPKVMHRQLTDQNGKVILYGPGHPRHGSPVTTREYFFDYIDDFGKRREVIIQEHSIGHEFSDAAASGAKTPAERPHFNVRAIDRSALPDGKGPVPERHGVPDWNDSSIGAHYYW